MILHSQPALVISQSQESQFFAEYFCPLQKQCPLLEETDLHFPGVGTGCRDRQSSDASDTGEGGFYQLLLRGQVVAVQYHSGDQNQGPIPGTHNAKQWEGGGSRGENQDPGQ